MKNELHVCRACGKHDTTSRSQICTRCLGYTPYRSKDPYRRSKQLDMDDKRSSAPGPTVEGDDDVEDE